MNEIGYEQNNDLLVDSVIIRKYIFLNCHMVYLCQFPDIYRSLRHFWEIVIAFEKKQEIVIQNLDTSLHEVVGATIITYF